MLPEIQAYQKWLRRRSPHASTPIHYGSDLKLFFKWLDKPIDQVTVVDVDAYIEHCQKQAFAIATINRRLTALRGFYNFLAVHDPQAPPNPVLPQRHYIRRGILLPRDVEDESIQQLFSVIDSLRDQTMFMLMLRCGLRVSEVRKLSMNDLYLHPAPGSLPRLWLNGKGDRQRVAYLSRQMLALLKRYLESRPLTSEPAVFLNRFGRRFTVTGIQDRLAHYCHIAGVWITCHQLRHTFARHLVEADTPVVSIQHLLGHSRVSTTQVYLHISDHKVQSDYETAIQEVQRRFAEGGWS
ncbi:MAG: tyrosine-type recombinase/integrase [Anaerolineaceae bacterium]|nr:tyrosine-type recombinase/integrase [Anaerolineaceae bacterium]